MTVSFRLVGWLCEIDEVEGEGSITDPAVTVRKDRTQGDRQATEGTANIEEAVGKIDLALGFDRTDQYVDREYVAALHSAGIARSMSRAGNCYDNAAMESFWSNFKTETQMDVKLPATRHQARLAIFDHIETFYNPKGRHSSLGYLSPVAFEKLHTKIDSLAA